MNLAFHSKDIKWILAEWKMLKSPPRPTIFLIHRNMFKTLKTEFDKQQIIFSFFLLSDCLPFIIIIYKIIISNY